MYQGGGQAVAVFFNSGAPTNGVSGTLAGIAPPGALLITDEPAFYQNSNTTLSPTWSASALTGAGSITSGTINGASIGATTPSTGAFTWVDFSTAWGLTAIGTNRAGALALTKQKNEVTTGATTTGVTLPASATVGVGGVVWITNNVGNSFHVYAAGSDTVDTIAGSTGVVLGSAKIGAFWVSAAGAYKSEAYAWAIST